MIEAAGGWDFGLVDLPSFEGFVLVASFAHFAATFDSFEGFAELVASFVNSVELVASSEGSAGPVASFGSFVGPSAGSSVLVDSLIAVVVEFVIDAAAAFVSSEDPCSGFAAFAGDFADLDSDYHP